MRAERLPQLLVPALADQVQVEVAQRGQEAVRVLHLLVRALVRHQQPVRRDLVQRQQAGEEAVPVVVQLGPQPAAEDAHRAGEGPEGPHGDPAGDRVGAQHGVRVVVGAGEQPLPVGGVQGGGGGGLGGTGGGGYGLLADRPRGDGLLAGRLLDDRLLDGRLPGDGLPRRGLLHRGLLHRGLLRRGLLRGRLLRGRLLRGGLLAGRLLRSRLLGGRLLRVGTAGRGAGGHGRGLLGAVGSRGGRHSGSGADRRRTAASGTVSQSGRCRASYRTS